MTPVLRTGAVVVAIAAILLLPMAPFASDYIMTLGVTIALFAVLSTGLNLMYGYAGLLSFAQVGFFGIGAYTAALLTMDLGWTMWTGSLAGGVVAVAFSLIIGLAAMRLPRDAFAIVTLTFALLCLLVARDWVELTRGSMGIPGLPAPSITIPGVGRISINQPARFYYVMVPFALIALAIVHRVVRSRIGRTLLATKLNEPVARSQGINPLTHRLLAFGLSAAMSGIAGGIYAFFLTIVDPSIFDFYYIESMLIMTIIGGPGSFWGVLAATAVFVVLPDFLRFSTDLRMVLYGAVLVVAMLLFPQGFGGLRRKAKPGRV